MSNSFTSKAIAISDSPIESQKVYQSFESDGVMCLAVTGLISLSTVLFLLTVKTPQRKTYKDTHVFGYFVSLLLANVVQSVGTVMNLKWITQGGVLAGPFCSAQGGIKQAGNIGNALWSFMLSLHLFNILFLRRGATKVGFHATLFVGWSVIAIIVIVPAALQRPEKGPYFGISGTWCWITANYPLQRIFLEYFLEYLSAGFSFILYTAILLRVRGNLVIQDGKWRLQFVPRSKSWQLAIGRDLIDSAMLKVAKKMVWFPIAYTFIIVPISLARLTEFAGKHVPFWATILTAVIYNLTGFINVILVVITHRVVPEVNTLPKFTTPRKPISLSAAGGVTPFTQDRSDTAEKYRQDRVARIAFPSRTHSVSSRSSLLSMDSVYSQPSPMAPL